MIRSLLHLWQERRGAGMAQSIIMLGLVALAGIAGFKALGTTTSDHADCAGEAVSTLSAVQCKKTASEDEGGSVGEAPPAPEGDAGDESEAEEPDPLDELIQLALDIFGVTDAVKCFTEGDILACALTVASFGFFKIIGVIAKLAKNAKRIADLIGRLGKSKKADQGKKGDNGGGKKDGEGKKDDKEPEKKDDAKKIAECEGIHGAYKARETQCRKCVRTDTAEERAAKIACFTEVHSGRSAYLAKRCDFVLPGSKARGSEVAERGHKTQLEGIGNAITKCNSLPTQ